VETGTFQGSAVLWKHQRHHRYTCTCISSETKSSSPQRRITTRQKHLVYSLSFRYRTLVWLFTVLSPFQDCFHLYGDVMHHCRWRAAKFRPILGIRGLWAGRDFYRATSAVKRGLGFSGLIRRTAPFSHLLRHTWGCGGPSLTRILKSDMNI
jgi:hypothetical protein